MNNASLAFRNVLRNRRRSLATLLAMTLGAMTVLLFGGYSRDIAYTLETGYVQHGGHLQLLRKDYFLFGSGNPTGYGISDYLRIIDRIRSDPVLGSKVTVATPILQLGGVAGNFAQGVSRTVLVTGMETEGQNRLHAWNDYGTFHKPRLSALTGTPDNAALIGTGVARVLQLCASLPATKNCPRPTAVSRPAGDKLPDDIAALSGELVAPAPAADAEPWIELLAANAHGAPNIARLKVIQTEGQGSKEFDDVYVAMHLSQAQRLLYGQEPPKVTAIVLQLRHTADLQATKVRLTELLEQPGLAAPGEALEIREFREIYPFFGQAILMFQTIFGFIAILIGAIVLFTVGNTMGMAVMERTVEIGTLRAMGERQGSIRGLFLMEGLILGGLGAALGVAVAIVIAALVNHSGLQWVPPGWARPVPFVLRVWGESQMITSTAVGVVVVAAASAWWPARRAARLNVVSALRYV